MESKNMKKQKDKASVLDIAAAIASIITIIFRLVP